MTSQNPRSTFSAICVSNGLVRVRTRATVGPRNCVDYSRASASQSQSTGFLPKLAGVIAAFLPLRRRLREPVEHCGPFKLRAPAFFSSRGPSLLIRIWAGSQVTAGKCFSLLRALLKHCQEPRSRVFHGFQVSPGGFPFDAHLTPSAATCGLVAVSDGHRSSKGKIGNVRKSSGEIRNVIR